MRNCIFIFLEFWEFCLYISLHELFSINADSFIIARKNLSSAVLEKQHLKIFEKITIRLFFYYSLTVILKFPLYTSFTAVSQASIHLDLQWNRFPLLHFQNKCIPSLHASYALPRNPLPGMPGGIRIHPDYMAVDAL